MSMSVEGGTLRTNRLDMPHADGFVRCLHLMRLYPLSGHPNPRHYLRV